MFPQIAAVSKGLMNFVYSTQLMVGLLPKGMLAKHYIYPIHKTPVDQQQEDGYYTTKTHRSLASASGIYGMDKELYPT